MLQYLYTLDYATEHLWSNNGEDGILVNQVGSDKPLRQIPIPQLLFDISVYLMGDKYGIHGLKGMASEKFAATLKPYAKQPFSGINVGPLAILIRSIYGSTPESDKGLRRHILDFTKPHLKHLLTLEDFKTVLAENPEFSYQLLVQEAEGRVEEAPQSKRQKFLSKKPYRGNGP